MGVVLAYLTRVIPAKAGTQNFSGSATHPRCDIPRKVAGARSRLRRPLAAGKVSQSTTETLPSSLSCQISAMMLALLIASLSLPHGLPAGAILHGEERRGAVLVRLEGAPALSWQACAAACGYHEACQAWTHSAYQNRCTLHAAPLTPRPFPGAVTGLSPSLAARIERSSERPPSAREREALQGHAPAQPTFSRALSETAQDQLFRNVKPDRRLTISRDAKSGIGTGCLPSSPSLPGEPDRVWRETHGYRKQASPPHRTGAGKILRAPPHASA
jgi:hypothetical protein